ncbi:Doublesex- and mab-3-related transcription like protein [Argiope bruennichi]|uniref:Doublesex- and mab-3-related transcription like protein n=1 Tax=Argiope bruennichi TaxID=94029 RepID=A0A8T0EEX0_ARGBR|nr:Doublesex- and mab-3-related transcription like protein [Argiope bruennichi]
MKSDIVLRRQHVCRAMEAHSENFWESGKRYGEEKYSPGLMSEEEIDVVGLSPEEESRKTGGKPPLGDTRPHLRDPRPADSVSKSPVERSGSLLDRNYQPPAPALIPEDMCYAEPVKVHLKRFEPTIVSGSVLDRRMPEEKNYQSVPIMNSVRSVAEPVPHYRPIWPYPHPQAPVVGVAVAMPSEYSNDVLQHPNYAESRHYGKVSVIFNASSERVTSLSHTVTTGHPYVSASHPSNGFAYVHENYARYNNHGKVSNYTKVMPPEEAGSRISPLPRPSDNSQQYLETTPHNKRIYYEEKSFGGRKIPRYVDASNFNKLPQENSDNVNSLPPADVDNVNYPKGPSADMRERYNTQLVPNSDITSHNDLEKSDFINSSSENVRETTLPLSHQDPEDTMSEYVSEQSVVRNSPPQLNYTSESQYENYGHYGKNAASKNSTVHSSDDSSSAIRLQYHEDVQRVTEDSNRDPSQTGKYAKCSNHGNVSESTSASTEEVYVCSEIEICSSSASEDRLSQRDHIEQDSQTKSEVSKNLSQTSVTEITSAVSLSGEQNKSEEKKRVPTCARCRNHNVTAILKGHKVNCRWRNCDCSKCILVHKRQAVMAKQVALNRQQQYKNSDVLSPSSLASSDVILETSQSEYLKHLKNSPT